MTTLLDQISQFSKVVADTAEIESILFIYLLLVIKKFKPVDATTNPSLILAACIQPEYSHFIDEIIQIERSNETFKELDELIDRVFDHLVSKKFQLCYWVDSKIWLRNMQIYKGTSFNRD